MYKKISKIFSIKAFSALLAISIFTGQANAFNFFGLNSLFSGSKLSSKGTLNSCKNIKVSSKSIKKAKKSFISTKTVFGVLALGLAASAWFFWPKIKGLFTKNNTPNPDQNPDSGKPGSKEFKQIYDLKKYLSDRLTTDADHRTTDGFCINCIDGKTGKTPLQLAVYNGDFNAVKLFVEYGAIVRDEDIIDASSNEIKNYLTIAKNTKK